MRNRYQQSIRGWNNMINNAIPSESKIKTPKNIKMDYEIY